MTRQIPKKIVHQGGSGIGIIFRNSFYTKASLILICCFSVKVFFSCTLPDPDDMSYNKIELEIIDNSGHPSYPSNSDTLYSDAVSMKITLSDSTIYYYYRSNTLKAAELFSFESAYAFSPYESYQALHLVRDIQVYTVFDIDDQFKAGDNISDSVLYSLEYTFAMYMVEEDAIKFANSVQSDAACSFMLYLKSSIKNTQAQFRVEVSLDNDTKLIGTTGLYPVMPSNL